MATLISFQNQLLITKFCMPVAPSSLIARPRLNNLLEKSLKYPLTIISAPAGFGKTTLLSTWARSLPAYQPLVAWVSLDEEDNNPNQFWTYVLTALSKQKPELFSTLITEIRSLAAPPSSKSLLTKLINLLAESNDSFLLILDDFHVVTEQQLHIDLSYLIEYLPSQLHIIVSTRTDPFLPLPQLRARGQVLEVRTEQLRCTVEETKAFFQEVMSIDLPDKTIQAVTVRTEGWLVGLHLLGLSLPSQADPTSLLQELSGDQHYILDYLTEVVLRQQPQDLQVFLLSTCILNHLNASLCDAVMGQSGSQKILQRIEQANLFVVALDNKREWYRYHPLFAEALRSQMERKQSDQAPMLHYRASIWYAQNGQITEAILHAFNAHQWEWAADLIERLPVLADTNGEGRQELIPPRLLLLRGWLEQLPAEIMHSRPHLCVISAFMLREICPFSLLDGWLDIAEAKLTDSLTTQEHKEVSCSMSDPKIQQELKAQLGQVFIQRAMLRAMSANGEAALALCQKALPLLSADHLVPRTMVAWCQVWAFYYSANDAVVAVESGRQTISLAHKTKQSNLAATCAYSVALYMIGAGRLHEAYELLQQERDLLAQPGRLMSHSESKVINIQAEVVREWNQLDEALSMAEESIIQHKQTDLRGSLTLLTCGYAILLRVYLSRGDLDAACGVLQELETISTRMNEPVYVYHYSLFTIVDQVRVWLACGKLDQATHWMEKLELRKWHNSLFAREREGVACIRILLAKNSPDLALQRLEPVLQRTIAGQRWTHVIEARLLQAIAYEMCQQQTEALNALSEAVRLGEPEGYIRSFLEEGTLIETLLYRLRKRDHKNGPTPYLDTLLTAFQKDSIAHEQMRESTKKPSLPEPLSERELQVLDLLARGASNSEIAQELVITIDTVKRHVSHIFSKLGVLNRVQAARQAREQGLLAERS